MSSVSATSSPFQLVVAFPNPKTKTLTFIGPNHEAVNSIKQDLYTAKDLDGKWKVFAAKVRNPGDWKIIFGVNPKICRGL